MKSLRIPLAAILAASLAQALIGKTAEEVAPLLIGSSVPSASLVDQQGQSVQLNEVLGGKPSVVIFYRGSWCPYCNTHLSELGQIEGKLKEMGYQIIAISPDTPEKLNATAAKNELGYQLYSDADYHAMNAFGVAFDRGKGGQLPVPSVFLVTPENEISFQYVNPNYKFRISGELLLAAAKAGMM